MSGPDIGRLLEESGAILRGHFLLTSGRHSDVYFEKFRLLEQPGLTSTLCGEIAEAFGGAGVGCVAGPLTGGILIAFDVARRLGVRALYVESENGEKTLRRGASIAPGTRVLVVDDVLTTGISVRETMGVVASAGGEVVGVAVLIDRSGGAVDFGVPLHAAYRVEADTYAPDAVPDWLAAIPITKPGTRKL